MKTSEMKVRITGMHRAYISMELYKHMKEVDKRSVELIYQFTEREWNNEIPTPKIYI